MSYEEAFQWTKKLMVKIDGNDYQSDEVKTAYQNLAATCQQHLMQKLAAERAQIKPGDTEAINHSIREAILCAKMFTDRGGYNIDSDLTNPDWAASMLKDAVDFTGLSMAYMEKQKEKESPLKKAIDTRKSEIITYLENPQIQSNPQSAQFAKEAKDTLNKETFDMGELAQQYMYINMIGCMKDGTRFDPENCQTEASAMMTEFIESSQKEFYEFFDDSRGTEGAVDEKLVRIQNMIGRNFSTEERSAFILLSEIEGFGTLDLSDKTWKTAAEVAKVAAVITAAIAAGIATGGAGFVAMASAMGATSALSTALVYQKGFDDTSDFAKVYGKDFAIGAIGGAIGKVAQGGRAAFIASRSGAVGANQAMQIMLKGGPRAAALAKYFDDAVNVGGRLRHGSFAGELVLDGAAGILADTGLSTAFDGGSFLDNLQTAYKNPSSYFGLAAGAGMNIGPNILRALKKANPDQINAVNIAMKDINHARTKLDDLGVLNRIDADMKAGLVQNVDDYMDMNQDILPDHARNHIRSMLLAQHDFKLHLDSLGVGPTMRDVAMPTVKNTAQFVQKSAKSLGGYTKSMSYILKSGNLTDRAKDKLADTYLLATGTLAIMKKKIGSLPKGKLKESMEANYVKSKAALAKVFYASREVGGLFAKNGKEGFGIKKGLTNTKEALKKIKSILPNGQTLSNLSISSQKIALDSLLLGMDSVAFMWRQVAKLKPGKLRDVFKRQVKEAEENLNQAKKKFSEKAIKDAQAERTVYSGTSQKPSNKVYEDGTFNDPKDIEYLLGKDLKPGDELISRSGTRRVITGKAPNGEYTTVTYKNGKIIDKSMAWDASDTWILRQIRRGGQSQADSAIKDVQYSKKDTFETQSDIDWKLRKGLSVGSEMIFNAGTRRVVIDIRGDQYRYVTFAKDGTALDIGISSKSSLLKANKRGQFSEVRNGDTYNAQKAFSDFKHQKNSKKNKSAETRTKEKKGSSDKPKENTSNIKEIEYPEDVNVAQRLLGVKPGAGKREITKAHRTLILKNHPDNYTEGTPEYDVIVKNAQSINQAKDLLLEELKNAA